MTTPAAVPATTPKEQNKKIVDVVQTRVNQLVSTGDIHLPPGYSAANAIKSAYLILQGTVDRDKKPVLEVCTQESVSNTLFSMVIQGLNPEKDQCYFVAYGRTLTLMRSYFGQMALAKRVNPEIADIAAEVVYKGDTLKFKIVKGRKIITDHEQSWDPDGKPREITAAYAMVIDHNGCVLATEFMPIAQIHQSWRQSRQAPFDEKGAIKANSVHAKFPEEMAKKTAITKVCKPFINSSDDSSILGQVLRQERKEQQLLELQEDYEANANQQLIELDTPTEPEPTVETRPPQVDPDTGEIIPDNPPQPVDAMGSVPPFMQ